MRYVIGIDLGGTAVNYTVADEQQNILTQGLCEHPARSVEGPDICLAQIADGLSLALNKSGVSLNSVAAIGLDTPGPASAKGILSAKGSTNFVHPSWVSFDIRGELEKILGIHPSFISMMLMLPPSGAISPSSAPEAAKPPSPSW